MHTNDPVLTKEIDGLIDKYDLLNKEVILTDPELDTFFSLVEDAVERRRTQRSNVLKDIKPSKPVDRNKFPGCYDFASLYPTVQKTIIPENWKELKRKKLIAERKAKLEKINSICVGQENQESQE
jgi:hypothetical protein